MPTPPSNAAIAQCARWVAVASSPCRRTDTDPVHPADGLANFTHDPIATVGQDDGQGGVQSARPTRVDGLSEFRELFRREPVDSLDLLDPAGCPFDVPPEPLEVTVEFADRLVVRDEVPVATGQEVAPLAGLRVLQEREDVVEFLDDLASLIDPPGCLDCMDKCPE